MDPHIKTVKFPMLDTGLGREAGFRDDAELAEAAKKQRDELDPAVRDLVDEFNRRMDDQFINGGG